MSSSDRARAGLFILLVLFAQSVLADGEADREARLRAAFTFNFASFTEWPPLGDAANFTIGIWKNENQQAAVKTELSGKSVKGKPLDVQLLAGDDIGKDVRLVILDSNGDVKKLISSVEGKPVLTVSRYEEHCSQGVIICFVKEGEKLRFVVNKASLDKSGLKLSSQLLKLARIVP